jgi:hypothetical protein
MDDSENKTSIDDLVETWRSIIVGENKSWVLFEHGTCVIFTNATGDLAKQATDLLAEWGPVQVGTDAGDFDVVELAEHPGWVVTCHHPDILTYVDQEEVGAQAAEIMIGLIGRSKRDQDAHELTVVHVEQNDG